MLVVFTRMMLRSGGRKSLGPVQEDEKVVSRRADEVRDQKF